MKPISDCELLHRWQSDSDRDAMDELVRRNIHFVYGAARRQLPTGYHAWAEDVTQAVFMLLMHKSPRVRSDAALAAWLHRAARYAAANARRMLTRQAHRDRRAARPEAQMNPSNSPEAQEYRELLPVLDEAIDRLPERDRSGVVMCFFQRYTYGQIGAVLGITEEAARKRVSRAVDRMREHFAQRGVLTSSAALCAALVSESTIAAPATLAGATADLATLSQLAAGAGGAASSTTTIMNGVIHTMLMTKLKLAAAACAAIVFGGAVTGAAIHQIGAPSPATVVTSTARALSADEFKASTDKLQAEFLGVNKWGAGGAGWFAIDGSPVDDPRGPFTNLQRRVSDEVTHQIILRVTGPAAGGYSVRVPAGRTYGMTDLTPTDDEAYLLIPFSAAPDKRAVDVELLLADGEWNTVGTREHEEPGAPLEPLVTEHGGVAFTHISETRDGHAMVYVAHEFKPEQGQFEVFAVDAQGAERRCVNVDGGRVGNFSAVQYVYDLAPEQITGLSVKVRPFNKKVTAKNVALDPAHPTKPQIVVEDQPARD
jgi:RNA polymerase sigma factor (sigma-70 family)